MTAFATVRDAESESGMRTGLTSKAAAPAGPPLAGSSRGKRPRDGAPVTDRALSLLSVFSDRRRVLTLSELARHAEMPLTTALRLVRRLVDWGALERLDDGRYVIGVRLWEIASLSPRGHGLRQLAMPFMKDLHEITRQHVLLAVRDGRDAVLIERLSSRGAPAVAYRVGGRAPLRSTAVGLVLLAGASEELREDLITSPPDSVPGFLPQLGGELRTTLRDVALHGVATVHRRSPSATVSVAAPVRDSEGLVVAAVSIVAADSGSSSQLYDHVVRATARAISRSLHLLRA